VRRRQFLLAPLILAVGRVGAQVNYPAVDAESVLQFPRDHGSHPAFRTEWWYITGWVRDDAGRDFGMQITFFRNRPGVAEAGTSRFAPTQLLFAHAAISDPRFGRLRHDQRAARAGFGLAEAAEDTTDVHVQNWSLRLAENRYTAHVVARDFTLELVFAADRPILLQGTRGVSRKGPRPQQASYYYSRPQLAASGQMALDGRAGDVRGIAWLDHEWSSAYLAPEARGWDWVGVNLGDGSALMVFRIRDQSGAAYWAGGTLQDRAGNSRALSRSQVRFTPLRHWRSPRTGIEYPVSFRIEAGELDISLEPLQDDQELDSRASVGTIYWEGAVRAFADAHEIGRGYLELTGYGSALKL
jgi:predicted secreted hydrolase